jgi:hypothetical protein
MCFVVNGANIGCRAKSLRLFDRCQAGVFELWVPSGTATCGCKVKNRPQGVEVRGSARVLVGIGHFAVHLSAPKVANYALAATKNAEAWDIAIVGIDIGAGVVAFRVGVDL